MPGTRREEQELIRRANRGDAGAFEALYRHHRDWVVGLAMRFTGDRDDALDVLQETFAYFFRKFPGFKLTASVRGFLFPVVRSHSINILRRRRKVMPMEAVDAQATDRMPWHPAPASDLQKLVQNLPEAQRQVVLLRFALGMQLGEIAEALGIAIGTVKSRLHNALKTLRSVARDPGAHQR